MFKKIYYINLDHRTDRREHMEKELKKINFSGPIERISAAYGKNMDNQCIPSTLFTKEATAATTRKDDINSTNTMTKGAMGVAMSQKWIYEKVLTGSEDYVLILEDDVNIPDDFMTKFKEFLKKVPNFDILFIGYSHNNIISSEEDYDIVNKNWGLFSYIINKKAAKKLIELFPITNQLDDEMFRAFPSLDVFAIKRENRLITSLPSSVNTQFGTDIQYDREGFLNVFREGFQNVFREGFQNIYLQDNDLNLGIILSIIIILFLALYFYKKK